MKPGWFPTAFMGVALCAQVAAHDLITADSAQAYLSATAVLQKTATSQAPAAARAQALYELGKTLDEIRDLLNRDLEAHGRVQGLPSNVLMNELQAQGTALAFDPSRNRFSANLGYYRQALKLAPAGAFAPDAGFRVLRGYFYDSYTADPLRPAGQTPVQLAVQIGLAESLLKAYPQHPEREEIRFILLVHTLQAALAAGVEKERAALARRARALAGDFVSDYPDSLRTAAVPQLLDSLGGAR